MKLFSDFIIELVGMTAIYYMTKPFEIIVGLIVYSAITNIEKVYYWTLKRNDIALILLHQGVSLKHQVNLDEFQSNHSCF